VVSIFDSSGFASFLLSFFGRLCFLVCPPLPKVTENTPDHVLIIGQTGAGKSFFIADYIQEIKHIHNKAVFVFTASTKSEPYDKLNPCNKVVKNLQNKLLEECYFVVSS
jgi:type IV secretory pathway VirB4 component